jgi:hypothetical protein
MTYNSHPGNQTQLLHPFFSQPIGDRPFAISNANNLARINWWNWYHTPIFGIPLDGQE